MADRFWVETLQCVAERPAGRDQAQEVMFLRTAHLLEYLIDRRGWPAGVRGLP
jgi:hypothetical protein